MRLIFIFTGIIMEIKTLRLVTTNSVQQTFIEYTRLQERNEKDEVLAFEFTVN